MKIPAFITKDFNLFELFKGGSTALLFKSGGIVTGYLFFLFLSRVFGAQVQGVFSVCWTILMIASVIARMGLDTSIVRFISEFSAKRKGREIIAVYHKGLIIVAVSGFVVTILMIVFSAPISSLYFEDSSGSTLVSWLGLAVIPFSIMSYNAESIRGLKKIFHYSLFQNGTIYLLIMLFMIIIAVFSLNSNYIILSVCLSVSLLMIYSFLLIKKFILAGPVPVSAPAENSSRSYRFLLSVSFPMLLTNSMYMILNWTDIQMLSIFMDETSVGIYTIAVKIAAVNVVGLAAVNTIASPKFSELYNSGKFHEFKTTVKQTTLINTLISLPVLIIIFLMPDFLLRLFGTEFGSGKEAMLILAAGQFVAAFSGSGLHILNMTGKEKTGRNIIISGAFLNILLNYWLIPVYGITGAAIATATSTLVWRSITVFYIHKYFHFLPYPFFIKKRS